MKIAISGPMGSGKTTIANLIKETNYEYQIYSFGQKIKDLAYELFNMNKDFKDRSLLINIADKMREIDPDVWAKYIIKQTTDKKCCIIDDLRFQNELNLLENNSNDWIYFVLQIDENTRLNRLKNLSQSEQQNLSRSARNMARATGTVGSQLGLLTGDR